MNSGEQGYNFKVKTRNLEIKREKKEPIMIPLLEVIITGNPRIRMVPPIMKEIRKKTDSIEGDYISITDLSNLDAGRLLEQLIVHGLKMPYKKLLSVSNPALISFVMLNKQQMKENKIDNALEQINKEKYDADEQEYRYVFIEKLSEIVPITKNFIKNEVIEI